MSDTKKTSKFVKILQIASTIIGALIAFFGGNAAASCLINNIF